MSVDTVNQALTTVRLRIQSNKATWGQDGAHSMVIKCECLRSYLMDEDVEGFIACTQRMLATSPDSMCEILNQLFEELLGNEDAVWEEFEAVLRSA